LTCALTVTALSDSRLHSMTNHPIRWGILGTAQIARRNWQAISHTGDATVTAVASRDLARSRQFIADCQRVVPMGSVPEAFGSYEELLASSKVDAVYIPLPTAVRKDWVIRAARAGKHVLCEKPCATNAADLEEMVDACRAAGVQFMDGVMFMHSLRLPAMRKVLDGGLGVGSIRRITSNFSFHGQGTFLETNIRANGKLEPLGCLGDLGWYCVRFSLWTMNWQAPRTVSARLSAHAGPNPVPMDFSAELLFDNGVSAGFGCAFTAAFQQWAIVSGTTGQMRLNDFVLPCAGSEVSFDITELASVADGLSGRFKLNTTRHGVAEHGESHPTSQDTCMFRNFGAQIRKGTLNAEWPEISLKTQRVVDACYAAAAEASKQR
jgi:predicted dehydrogenase